MSKEQSVSESRPCFHLKWLYKAFHFGWTFLEWNKIPQYSSIHLPVFSQDEQTSHQPSDRDFGSGSVLGLFTCTGFRKTMYKPLCVLVYADQGGCEAEGCSMEGLPGATTLLWVWKVWLARDSLVFPRAVWTISELGMLFSEGEENVYATSSCFICARECELLYSRHWQFSEMKERGIRLRLLLVPPLPSPCRYSSHVKRVVEAEEWGSCSTPDKLSLKWFLLGR